MVEHNTRGWTFDSLIEYIDTRFASSEKVVSEALKSSEKAIVKAETAAEKRFDSVNEFRQTLQDQQLTFSRKEATEFRLGAIDKRLTDIEKRIAENTGRISGMLMIVFGVGWLITTGIAILAIFRH